jgi:hypothetical protein
MYSILSIHFMSNIMGATNRTGITYHFRAPDFTLVVTQSLVFCVPDFTLVVTQSLVFCVPDITLVVTQSLVFRSTWLHPSCYSIFSFLCKSKCFVEHFLSFCPFVAIVLSVLLWFTAFDYSFAVFFTFLSINDTTETHYLTYL